MRSRTLRGSLTPIRRNEGVDASVEITSICPMPIIRSENPCVMRISFTRPRSISLPFVRTVPSDDEALSSQNGLGVGRYLLQRVSPPTEHAPTAACAARPSPASRSDVLIFSSWALHSLHLAPVPELAPFRAMATTTLHYCLPDGSIPYEPGPFFKRSTPGVRVRLWFLRPGVTPHGGRLGYP